MSSERTVRALNCGAISPVPMSGVYMWVLGINLKSSHRKISSLPTERDIFPAPGLTLCEVETVKSDGSPDLALGNRLDGSSSLGRKKK